MGNFNPMQFMAMMRNCGNPQDFMLKYMQNESKNNPFMANLMKLAKSGDTAGLEIIARNVAASRGVDYDEAFEGFKKTFGFK